MDIQRHGAIAIQITAASIAEADAIEMFLRTRVDVNLGDRTATNLRIGEIQREIDALTVEQQAAINANDPALAPFIQDRDQHIGDLRALQRLEERRGNRPVVSARAA